MNAMVGFWFLVCLLVGVGIGILFNAVEIGGVVGLGVGLLIILLFRNKDRKI